MPIHVLQYVIHAQKRSCTHLSFGTYVQKRLFTFSVTPPTLLHSVFTQNFQRLGLLWLGVNETGLTPLGEPMPKFFSGSDLSFFAGGGVVTCRAHLLAFSQHNDITVIHI